MELKEIAQTLAKSRLDEVKKTLLSQGKVGLTFDSCGLACTLYAWKTVSSAKTVVVLADFKEAWRLYNQLLLWGGEDSKDKTIWLPPSGNTNIKNKRFEESVSGVRIDALTRLTENSYDTVVAPIEGVVQKTVLREDFLDTRAVFECGKTYNFGKTLEKLIDLGYEVEDQVDVPNTVAKRGGIIDVFPQGFLHPVRLEFDSNTLETIRSFDQVSQRSLKRLENLAVPLTSEKNRLTPSVSPNSNNGELSQLSAKTMGSISTYFDQEETNIVLVRPSEVLAVVDTLNKTSQKFSLEKTDTKNTDQRVEPKLNQDSFLSKEEFLKSFSGMKTLEIELFNAPNLDETKERVYHFNFRRPDTVSGGIEEATDSIKARLKGGERVCVVSIHSPRLMEFIGDKRVSFVYGQLNEGFETTLLEDKNETNVCVLSDRELFGVVKEPTYRFLEHKRPLPSAATLNVGDYVVHVEHGIARLGGLKRVGKNGLEHFVLEYAENDRLYVPIDQVHRIQPYEKPGGNVPKLSRLGTSIWQKTKSKIKRHTKLLAGELFARDAKRRAIKSSAIPKDHLWQTQMEGAFEFVETDDQLRSIEDVKKDLEGSTPMDRLVCGDVGYGKTEVALRAAFKVASNGGQVAVLAPTTLLANQHYAVFSERLRPFPIKVRMLSSFTTKSSQERVVEQLKSGGVEIVIGTHRLLQRDISFKSLKLAVIDEEHRFGVKHKEKIKEMSSGVNYLSMSATPIPRTLHLALSGVREISKIETAPTHRHPVQTYVTTISQEVVRNAIQNELARNGQVFFVHNRIRSIYEAARGIQQLVPDIRVGVAHAKMEPNELEAVMGAVYNHKLDVLVSTSIIESGLDLHNVNTLIVERADLFGLAQLYQLRGRVGRGHNHGYAYFLLPDAVKIPEEAEKRLRAILDNSELGSAMRLARDDLNIRGAGNILGAEQSGYMSSVGTRMYVQMLREAVEELKSTPSKLDDEKWVSRKTTEVSVIGDCQLPVSYIETLAHRLNIYRKLAESSNLEEVESVRDELIDRFGALPKPAKNAIELTAIRVQATVLGVGAISIDRDGVVMDFLEPIAPLKKPLEEQFLDHIKFGYKRVSLFPKTKSLEYLLKETKKALVTLSRLVLVEGNKGL